MRSAIALLALCVLAPTARAAGLESPDAFEAAIVKCLTSATAPAGCLDKHLRNRFPPGNDKLNEVVTQAGAFLEQWLAEDKVFAVHPVKTVVLGKYAERRIYLIEDTTGKFIMFDVTFTRTLGNWCVYRFNLTSKSDAVKTALGDVL